MRLAIRQLGALLRVALLMDFRSRNPLGGREVRRSRVLVSILVFYLLVGAALATGLPETLPPRVRIAALLVVAGTYVAFNILIEYQQIVLAAAESDVLFWRPVSSRVLFAARVMHVLVYVAMLSSALLALPSVEVALDAPRGFLPVWLAFVVAGFLNVVAATVLTVLAYTLLLRYVPWQRLQDALATFQVLMSVVILLGYQFLGPALQRVEMREGARGPVWFDLLPASWFATLPAVVGWGGWQGSLASVVLAAGGLAIAILYAGRVLAPAYAASLAGLGVAAQSSGSALPGQTTASTERTPLLQRLFGSYVARHPLRRAGFDFFLANLRGDGRLKVSLLPIVAMPVSLLLFALLAGEARDPYLSRPLHLQSPLPISSVGESGGAREAADPGASGEAAVGESPGSASARPEPGRSESASSESARSESAAAGSGGRRPGSSGSPGPASRGSRFSGAEPPGTESPGSVPVYGAVYLLVALALTVSRSLTTSPSWRGAWVFFLAPIRRFDIFYSGLLWGATCSLLLPAVGLLFVVLLVGWRDPVHVLAHLALPTGLAMVAVPVLLRMDAQVPFAREPVRHERSRDLLFGFVFLLPIGLAGLAHHALRRHAGALIAAGAVLCIVGTALWLLLRRALRLVAHARTFEG